MVSRRQNKKNTGSFTPSRKYYFHRQTIEYRLHSCGRKVFTRTSEQDVMSHLCMHGTLPLIKRQSCFVSNYQTFSPGFVQTEGNKQGDLIKSVDFRQEVRKSTRVISHHLWILLRYANFLENRVIVCECNAIPLQSHFYGLREKELFWCAILHSR